MARPTGCFVLCCAAGLLLGLLFHLTELPARRPLLLKAVCDLLWCGLCTGVLMLLALTWNGGQLRVFQIAGLGLGMALYFAGPAVLTRKAVGLFTGEKSKKRMQKSGKSD